MAASRHTMAARLLTEALLEEGEPEFLGKRLTALLQGGCSALAASGSSSQLLPQGDDWLSAHLASLGQSVCTHVFSKGDIAWNCRTCQAWRRRAD